MLLGFSTFGEFERLLLVVICDKTNARKLALMFS